MYAMPNKPPILPFVNQQKCVPDMSDDENGDEDAK